LLPFSIISVTQNENTGIKTILPLHHKLQAFATSTPLCPEIIHPIRQFRQMQFFGLMDKNDAGNRGEALLAYV